MGLLPFSNGLLLPFSDGLLLLCSDSLLEFLVLTVLGAELHAPLLWCHAANQRFGTNLLSPSHSLGVLGRRIVDSSSRLCRAPSPSDSVATNKIGY